MWAVPKSPLWLKVLVILTCPVTVPVILVMCALGYDVVSDWHRAQDYRDTLRSLKH